MPAEPQSLRNHARFHPIFHFVLLPIFLANLIIAIVLLVRAPGWLAVWGLVMAFALFLLAFIARVNPLKVQDRVIRLEERLRLAVLLPDPLRARIPELTESQLIGLRFASDSEVPALVERTLKENLKRGEIKKAITIWRPDTWRV